MILFLILFAIATSSAALSFSPCYFCFFLQQNCMFCDIAQLFWVVLV